jgi:hypothetical protein
MPACLPVVACLIVDACLPACLPNAIDAARAASYVLFVDDAAADNARDDANVDDACSDDDESARCF